jgi:hypothetical protein
MLEALSIDNLILRVKGEYREMPGLSLTFSQAQRFWNMEPSRCKTVLDALVHLQFLHKTPLGCYARRETFA